MTLPRAARLRASAEIRRVLDGARSRVGRFAALYWRQRDDASGPRAAFVVSRRLGGAAVRNRVRRRLAEAVRRHLDSLPATVDLVIVARRQAAAASFQEMERDLFGQLRAAGLVADGTGPGGEDGL